MIGQERRSRSAVASSFTPSLAALVRDLGRRHAEGLKARSPFEPAGKALAGSRKDAVLRGPIRDPRANHGAHDLHP